MGQLNNVGCLKQEDAKMVLLKLDVPWARFIGPLWNYHRVAKLLWEEFDMVGLVRDFVPAKKENALCTLE